MAIATFEVPQDLVEKTYEALTIAKASGRLKKGVNESTKAIERKSAKLVVIAGDVTPEEIVMHLPVLCDEKEVPYIFVPSKVELGKAAGIGVGSSSITITEEGEGKKLVDEIVNRLKTLKEGK